MYVDCHSHYLRHVEILEAIHASHVYHNTTIVILSNEFFVNLRPKGIQRTMLDKLMSVNNYLRKKKKN